MRTRLITAALSAGILTSLLAPAAGATSPDTTPSYRPVVPQEVRIVVTDPVGDTTTVADDTPVPAPTRADLSIDATEVVYHFTPGPRKSLSTKVSYARGYNGARAFNQHVVTRFDADGRHFVWTVHLRAPDAWPEVALFERIDGKRHVVGNYDSWFSASSGHDSSGAVISSSISLAELDVVTIDRIRTTTIYGHRARLDRTEAAGPFLVGVAPSPWPFPAR